MADVFVRRTTAFLLLLVFVLSVVCVAMVVLLVRTDNEPTIGNTQLPLQQQKDSRSPRMRDIFSDPLEDPSGPPLSFGQSSNATNISTQEAVKEVMTTTAMVKTASTSPTTEMPKTFPWEKKIRIPSSTIPYHYDLFLHPDFETATFEGHVSILIGVTSPMDYLVTHVKHMNVTFTELFESSSQKLDIDSAFEYKPNEFWVVRPKSTLTPGNYTLSLKFNGGLKGHIVGFYMSEYLTKSGERRSIVSSKFQPTDARRAFPCFDEPSFKSTFKVSLVRPSERYIALSNMPVQKETADSPSPALTTVEFQKSVPMVTYLACFIVCDFEYVEAMTNNGKPFRVYATPDQIDRAQYARDIGVSILNYFETYFEVEYPLPKQDMIAIPDFISGAMEHWGLITYREANLLYDDVNSSSSNKQRVAAVVSHELSHMWFGNLVTMKWWDDLWLNEGFASYIEYKGVAHYEKDWSMLEQFVSSDLHRVFKLDQILSSHPIVQQVNHPDEITEIFDAISYSKGASVLRMLENFIGAENFRIGVRNFLRKYKFSNAATQDLWNELQSTAPQGFNITRIMDTWTRQMGFPVINVNTMGENKTKLEIRQERFLVDPDAKSKHDSLYGYRWDIPVTIITESSPRNLFWFKMEDKMIVLDRPVDASWVKLNVDQYGYYRVNYDEQMWQELINLLKTNHELLSASDRANLIDDSFALAAAGKILYGIPFEIVSYLSNETHYIPWTTTYDHMEDIGNLLQSTPAYKFFRKYVVKLVDKHVSRIGWEDQGTHIEKRNRATILALACSNGHDGCMEGAVTKFRAWIQDSNYFIPANLRLVIYKNGIKGTGEREWDVLFERYQNELNAQEKIKMMRGLASTKEIWIANRFMELGRNETIVRRQDFFKMLAYLSYNPSTLPSVWNFVRSNWEWMVDEFGLNNRYLGRAVKTVGEQFSLPLKLKEVKAFFEEYPEAGSGKRARSQTLEKIEQNIKWVNSYSEHLYTWLKENTM